MRSEAEKGQARRLHDDGYRDGFHGRKARRTDDERYMASYRRGQERRTKLTMGRVDDDE